MACLGVFFSVTAEQAAALCKANGDEELMDLVESIEEAWDKDHLAQCDKAWDAMHRCLTDGRLEYGNGSYPLSHAVLGPRQLHEGDDYIVSVVLPHEVREVAAALQGITEDDFRRRYFELVPKNYAPEYGDTDLEYTWEWFLAVRDLYANAAHSGRAVLFTVDQ
jgi:hypothetical protein